MLLDARLIPNYLSPPPQGYPPSGGIRPQDVEIISTPSSSTSFRLGRRRITLPPVSRIVKLRVAQAAITPVMGRAVWLFSQLTVAEVKAPMLICIPPIRAEAVPAFLLKGARDSAEELGKIQPWQHKKRKIKKIVLNNSNIPSKLPAKSTIDVTTWQSSATFMICSLL